MFSLGMRIFCCLILILCVGMSVGSVNQGVGVTTVPWQVGDSWVIQITPVIDVPRIEDRDNQTHTIVGKTVWNDQPAFEVKWNNTRESDPKLQPDIRVEYYDCERLEYLGAMETLPWENPHIGISATITKRFLTDDLLIDPSNPFVETWISVEEEEDEYSYNTTTIPTNCVVTKNIKTRTTKTYQGSVSEENMTTPIGTFECWKITREIVKHEWEGSYTQTSGPVMNISTIIWKNGTKIVWEEIEEIGWVIAWKGEDFVIERAKATTWVSKELGVKVREEVTVDENYRIDVSELVYLDVSPPSPTSPSLTSFPTLLAIAPLLLWILRKKRP